MRHPSSPTAASSTTHPHSSLSPYGRLPTPKASRANLHDAATPPAIPTSTSFPASADTYTSARTGTGFGAALLETRPSDVPVQESEALSPPRKSQTMPLSTKSSMSAMGPTKMYSRPVELSLEDIRGFVQRAIEGRGEEDGVERWWKTSPPPEGRPVRIYADGVYDLFHFGHALQLRQAKLSFPSVHLLVGVCSDKLCAEHKSAPAMTHAERCESIRHCRWADEVLPDAPWVVDQAWLDKHQIDYIAHDELVYPSKDLEDVYAFAKRTGKFVPTRRTPAISTSDLLERIVRGYRDGFFDSKLEKNGLPELLAADVDWDSSASIEKREKRKKRAQEKAQAQARELAQEQK
ncbi:hypothetical protein EHS25_002101 [Saitozyma podzolica]|uniref:choline-phosphate cytidylyltransferase n=1 Tax=Saitozyma podzolica TaxID=1890683 RepID=A0A427YEP8_9TREE|nr:hypothetical protein EHS25_002101 [Saitozyma podzolica]